MCIVIYKIYFLINASKIKVILHQLIQTYPYNTILNFYWKEKK